ncbi:alpha/beta hydrolase [Acuticoccus sp. MNP-M23]|uniref:alpha/beta hydrolase n=1 Tax=Acuticoccus sp. MNP-M23 TaxID=3072793 RepID=UPI0028162721|nr:alpha/beta hydrolase [Acuticoccus sp. MNP-M23]WMS45151.1 alpha/beta hydrolase [Acuticoccus sp. MNP-M23]
MWIEMAAADLAAERKAREENGRIAADAAPKMASETNVTFETPAGALPAIRLVPEGADDSAPADVFVHGGGWVFGSARQSIGTARRMAAQSRRTILSVDYLLAPETPWPAAADQVGALFDQLAAEGGLHAVAGSSAGAQIALAAMRRQADRGGALPRGALLFNGAFAMTADSWSHAAFGGGSDLLTTAAMTAYIAAYGAGADGDMTIADMFGLPPLWLSLGDQDPLIEDSLAVFQRALAAGTKVHLDIIPGVGHGFANNFHDLPRVDLAITDAMDWLGRL